MFFKIILSILEFPKLEVYFGISNLEITKILTNDVPVPSFYLILRRFNL